MHRPNFQATGLEKSTVANVFTGSRPVHRFSRQTLQQTFSALRPSCARLALEVQNLLTVKPDQDALDVDWDLEQVASVIQQLTWRELPSKHEYPEHRQLMESWLKLGRHLMNQD